MLKLSLAATARSSSHSSSNTTQRFPDLTDNALRRCVHRIGSRVVGTAGTVTDAWGVQEPWVLLEGEGCRIRFVVGRQVEIAGVKLAAWFFRGKFHRRVWWKFREVADVGWSVGIMGSGSAGIKCILYSSTDTTNLEHRLILCLISCMGISWGSVCKSCSDVSYKTIIFNRRMPRLHLASNINRIINSTHIKRKLLFLKCVIYVCESRHVHIIASFIVIAGSTWRSRIKRYSTRHFRFRALLNLNQIIYFRFHSFMLPLIILILHIRLVINLCLSYRCRIRIQYFNHSLINFVCLCFTIGIPNFILTVVIRIFWGADSNILVAIHILVQLILINMFICFSTTSLHDSLGCLIILLSFMSASMRYLFDFFQIDWLLSLTHHYMGTRHATRNLQKLILMLGLAYQRHGWILGIILL